MLSASRPARFWRLLGLIVLPVAFVFAAPPAWVARSNENAQVLLDAIAKTEPEFASSNGFASYDARSLDLSAGFDDRNRANLTAARDELGRRATSETDPLVREDLEILIKSANDRLRTDELEDRLMLPYVDVPQVIFYGEFVLLNDQVDPARHPAAIERLRRYTGLASGTKPVTELAEARYAEKAGNPALEAPYRGEVESHLVAIPRYATGIRQLFVNAGLDKTAGAAEALDALDAQFKAYADWLRTTVLPKARSDARLPAELYADRLKRVGLDVSPQEVIGRAQLAFGEVRNEMKTIARLVAKEHGFADSDYRAVIRELKRAQLTRAEVEPYYREVIDQLQEIIRRERIVSLPDRPMKMRIASEAETAAQPAPHFQPPPLVGGKDEEGVFVLTTENPGASGSDLAFDDFTFKAAAWTLTAHEGRPGHDLQFTSMLERGVSLARGIFAFNSVNVEGWALYAEAEVKPYEPLDGQLIALQYRLLRSARAFLDPMLNLGLTTRERALQVLMDDVCLSRGMATQEVDRYMFRLPGQATAYFYGYTRLLELRTATEITLASKFDRRAFNDFVIGQGLLPPDLLAKAVRAEFIPARQAGGAP